MDNYYIYFYFPESVELNDQQEVNDFIYHLQMILDRIDCEVESIFYYDSKNLENLLGYLDLLQEELSFTGLYTIRESIEILLQDLNFRDILIDLLHDTNEDHVYYRYIDQTSRIFVDSFPCILKEITEKKASGKDHKILLLNFHHSYPVELPIHLIKCYNDNTTPQVVSIEYCCGFNDVDVWIDRNTPEWKYNFQDNRHIDNHPDRIKKKSPLLDGIAGKERAAILLKRAIKDRKIHDYRINYDSEKNCYIRFEDENALHQYHGYHLVKNSDHQPHEEAVQEIPERVINILKYRKQLELV